MSSCRLLLSVIGLQINLTSDQLVLGSDVTSSSFLLVHETFFKYLLLF